MSKKPTNEEMPDPQDRLAASLEAAGPNEEMPDPQDRLAASLEAAGHAAWHWNSTTGSAWYSKTFLKLLGFSRVEFPNRFESFASNLHPEDIGRVFHAIASHLHAGSEFDLEFKMRTKEGTWRWVRARGSANIDGGKSNVMMGTLTAWPLFAARDRLAASTSDQLTAALQDQSKSSRDLEIVRKDLVAQNRALQEAQASAEAITKLKSSFLANMSHEIRTPMTAILGYIDLLSEEQEDPKDRALAISVIQRNSRDLLTIINNTLDLSKIEAGGMGVEIIPCAPLNMIQDVVALLQSRARTTGLELFVELKSPVPEIIETDPTRLRQILSNLIGNAIKFTEHGGVNVMVDLTKEALEPRVDPDASDAPPAPIRLRVQVKDTGIGIDEEQRLRLFKPFTQADPSITRRFGGTGLGLTISRRFSRMLGGNITSSSEVGRGSLFIIEIGIGNSNLGKMILTLPEYSPGKSNSKLQMTGHDSVTTKDLKDITVLVAEDGEDNRRLIVHHLTRAGMKTTVANNGLEAIKLALAAQRQSRAHDLILMDMQMPVMDGYEATKKLREKGWLGPIVAITAHAMLGDRERCIEAGCDEYLTKPIERNVLIQIVKKMAQKPQKNQNR
ncbi:MAG: PAS domain-containing hybrid sensor histidine kinase/response regulator [Phycisphaerales bacterium]|nr:PAS domain-containing hybrid sensor histidine kinase/response regulator [Phycisphaerales bacterium]